MVIGSVPPQRGLQHRFRGGGHVRPRSTGPPARAGWALAAVLGLASYGTARAADYGVEAEAGVWLRALLDLRIVRAGEAPSWMDRGPGKTRYGGIDDDGQFERVTRFAISQLALEPGGKLPWDVRLHAQVNWEGDVDDQGDVDPDHDAPRLVEGWLRREWADADGGWAVLAGVSNPPSSLELGPAWTPRYTLTPSALNTWLWEEGRQLGVEGEWWGTAWGGVDVSAIAGGGWGPDQQGILLAQRGWVLSDWLAGINSTLVLPSPGKVTHEFDERDGRPALYAVVNAKDPWKIGELRVAYYDNLGDKSVAGVWETRYGMAGVAVQPLPGLDVLFQYLIGETATRTNPFDSTFQALYPLVSYRWRNHRVSVRYDNFRVEDDDGQPPNSRERGEAVTFAYLFEFWLRHRLAFEYIIVDSDRPNGSAADPNDDGFQVSYRFRY